MHSIAVYVGAGLDFTPVLRLNWIQRFIYIDSQPLTEFGALEPCKEFSRPEFEYELLTAMRGLGRVTKIPNSNLIMVSLSGGRQLLYYINNCFPHAIDADCRAFISTASVLICCGHIPNPLILTLMKAGPKIFIGDNKTCYSGYDDESEMIKRIQQEPSIFEQYIRFDYQEREVSVTQHLSIQDLVSLEQQSQQSQQ